MDAHKVQVGSEILHYPFLVEEDNAKLVTLLSNYLSLGQIELARATLRQISSRSPQQAKSLLKCLITTKPPSQWYVSTIPPPPCACSSLVVLFFFFNFGWGGDVLQRLCGSAVPSHAHLAWLCINELALLHGGDHSVRVLTKGEGCI